MLLSLAIIFLVGLSAAAIFNALKLPRIIGMLLTGIVVGPYVSALCHCQKGREQHNDEYIIT